MAAATRGNSPKGALEHIFTVVLVYDSFVHEALTPLGASLFADLDSTDFKLPFTCPDTDDTNTTLTISLQPVTKKNIPVQIWYE
jgi:hypothetical protein